MVEACKRCWIKHSGHPYNNAGTCQCNLRRQNREASRKHKPIFLFSISGLLPAKIKYSMANTSFPDKYTITVDQVARDVAKVKLGKAVEPDEKFRDLAPLLSPPVTSLFNASLRDLYVPQKWRSAYVIPILKRS